MKRILSLLLALVASTAVGAAVNIPVRNPSGGTTTFNSGATVNKQYVAGTSYTNGTITFSGTPAGWLVNRAVFLPYQTTDGAWRVRFTIDAGITATTGLSFAVSGLTFKTGFAQALTIMDTSSSAVVVKAVVGGGSGTVNAIAQSAVSLIRISGDVELDSKPTWAD